MIDPGRTEPVYRRGRVVTRIKRRQLTPETVDALDANPHCYLTVGFEGIVRYYDPSDRSGWEAGPTIPIHAFN